MKRHDLVWRPIRRDELRTEFIHDPYRARLKYSDGTRCPDCGAHFDRGRWHWRDEPATQEALCPACHRIRDHLPAGYVTISGEFAHAHRDEIVRLIRHHETREKAEHPLNRIIALEARNGELAITTTDVHLARNLGEALHDAYQGDLDYHYNDAEYLLRVNWSR
ncbi:ATPase [Nitrogeniibacter mangrovi]|uniref:ATPase n=1 Tax=Nitrogeniibacter mangrovi TaxID=2016596 RepID=A0A6C1B1N5_9RHOO|nr:BCAM0308 family protein [Nitrogeniibacter mangrovi]QID16825.1 ATPase [Nitrogeniibacter mangrovi]